MEDGEAAEEPAARAPERPELLVLLEALVMSQVSEAAGGAPDQGEPGEVEHQGADPAGTSAPEPQQHDQGAPADGTERRERPLRARPAASVPAARRARAGRARRSERRRRRAVGLSAVVVAVSGLVFAITGGHGGVDEAAVRTAADRSAIAAPETSEATSTSAAPTTTVVPVTADPAAATAATDAPATTGPVPTVDTTPIVATAPPATTATTAARTTSTLPGEDAPQGESQPRASTSRVPVAGRIIVPRLGLDTTMYAGGELAQIDQGPSLMPRTAQPGRQGNTVVAGHRTTKTRPFYDLDKLEVGDTVTFVVPGGTYTYVFTHHSVVTEEGVHILKQGSGYEATLFACHPKGKSTHRIVAHFVLQSEPDPTPTTTTTTRPSTNTTLGPRLPGR